MRSRRPSIATRRGLIIRSRSQNGTKGGVSTKDDTLFRCPRVEDLLVLARSVNFCAHLVEAGGACLSDQEGKELAFGMYTDGNDSP